MKAIIKQLGISDYVSTLKSMQEFTKTRNEHTPNEIWLLEHPSVFTQGQAGKPEHILNESNIPIVQSDRGGQVTYHGPGQIIAYLLIDLKSLNINIREFVRKLEQAIIDFLAEYKIKGHIIEGAPGVYVDNAKIAAIGLRVKRGCTYHGISLNYDMDLSPFKDINPCGYSNLKVTQMKEHCSSTNKEYIYHKLSEKLLSLK